MMIVAMGILNPVFRDQVFSALTSFVSIILLLGIVGLAVFLLLQLRKTKDAQLSSKDRYHVSPQFAPQPSAAVVKPLRNNHDVPVTFRAGNPDLPFVTGEPIAPDFGYSAEEQARIQEIIQSMQPIKQEQNYSPQFIKWDDTILNVIEWKRFEVVTKEFLKMTGYEARETKIGADGGVDIRVTKRGTEGFEGIVQCKAWNTYKVGVKPVRELFGVMAAENVSKGMLVTSGSFTSEAEDFAKGKMILVSGAKFLKLIRKLPKEKQQKLLEIALEGDCRTPTCPQCDLKMTLREGKKGRNVGGQFWGCVRYPRCRQTLVYKQD